MKSGENENHRSDDITDDQLGDLEATGQIIAAGEKMDDPIAMYLNDVFTVPASMAGLPGISVPAGLSSDGLPLGLQVLGNAFDEETVFRVGGVLEEAAAFTARPQKWWGDKS